ncbi:MAG: hypothetical protein IPQ07_38025 [Myxococcales bacterium]|nr:hypothetical protein [Myxococcales bacterium]
MATFQLVGLDLYRERVKKLTGSLKPRQVSITLPEESVDKLEWLKESGRNFTTVNALLAKSMAEAFARGLDHIQAGGKDLKEPWRLAAEEWIDRVATRLSTGGGDLKGRMRALKPDTIKRKGFSKIGVDSGALLRSMVAAQVVIK